MNKAMLGCSSCKSEDDTCHKESLFQKLGLGTVVVSISISPGSHCFRRVRSLAVIFCRSLIDNLGVKQGKDCKLAEQVGPPSPGRQFQPRDFLSWSPSATGLPSEKECFSFFFMWTTSSNTYVFILILYFEGYFVVNMFIYRPNRILGTLSKLKAISSYWVIKILYPFVFIRKYLIVIHGILTLAAFHICT